MVLLYVVPVECGGCRDYVSPHILKVECGMEDELEEADDRIQSNTRGSIAANLISASSRLLSPVAPSPKGRPGRKLSAAMSVAVIEELEAKR